MPWIFFLLLIVLVAQIGFWNTLAAIFGAIGVIVLAIVIVIAIIVVAGISMMRRASRRY